jgi:hypothetical protein
VFARILARATPQYIPLVCIVPCAFLVIRKYFICGSDFGEEGSGTFDITIVSVGV